MPGRSVLIFPSSNTEMPLTSTWLKPTAYWCGLSKVERSADSRVVERYDVRGHAFAHESAVAQTESLRGQGSHLAHGIFER